MRVSTRRASSQHALRTALALAGLTSAVAFAIAPLALLAPPRAAAEPTGAPSAAGSTTTIASSRTGSGPTSTASGSAGTTGSTGATTTSVPEPDTHLRLLRQPTIAHYGETIGFVVQVTNAPDAAQLRLNIFANIAPAQATAGALDTATSVQQAIAGTLPKERVGYLPFTPLKDVPADGTGVRLDVNLVREPAVLAADVFLPTTGLYPVQIMVLDPNRTTPVAQLVTFLTLSDGAVPPPVDVALLLPVDGATGHQPDGSLALSSADRQRIADATDVLDAEPSMPVTIAPRPEMLETAAVLDPALTSRFVDAIGGRPVLARSYVRLDLAAAIAAGLQDDVARQLALGEQAMRAAANSVRPDRRTWLADGPLSPEALGTLRRLGAQQLVVDGSVLGTPIDRDAVAHRLRIATSDADLPLDVLVVDRQLNDVVFRSGSYASPTDDVLADQQLVAVIQALALDSARARHGRPGIVLVPPPGALDTRSQMHALRQRLLAVPGLSLATLDDLFHTTSAAQHADGTPVAVTLTTGAVSDLGPYARSLFLTRLAVQDFGSMLPATDRDALASLEGPLTVAAAADLDPTTAQQFVDRVGATIAPLRTAVQVVDGGTITLAGRTGELPVVLRNDDARTLTVKLFVLSNKLTVPDSGHLVTLPPHSTTRLRLPVTVRTPSWKFAARIEIRTPQGEEVVGSGGSLDLRSIGLSGLGIVASAGLGLVLASWWLHHFRTTRRRRRASAHPSAGSGGTAATTNVTV